MKTKLQNVFSNVDSCAIFGFSFLCERIRNKSYNKQEYEEVIEAIMRSDKLILFAPETELHSEYVNYWVNSLFAELEIYEIEVVFISTLSKSQLIIHFSDWDGSFLEAVKGIEN